MLLLAFWASLGSADQLRIMNFNTMCSVCDLGAKEEPFSQRIYEIADTVRRQDPDLISFQEFTFRRHVKKIEKILEEKYYAVFKKDGFYPASDSVLFVRRGRFQTLKYQGVWLGKKLPKFSFGWQFGIPRRFHSVVLLDTHTGREFIFSGSHFDNAFKNKNASSDYVQAFFQGQTLPIIFAGDTNLQPNFPAYKNLLGETMRNTFDETQQYTVTHNGAFVPRDLCHDHVGGDEWPKCRIDHVLLSKNAPWKVKSWGEDLFRYYNGEKFVSDHRAVIVDLE
jgi:endonuclease/exonuclease/phosphatase family metal-dependent hydrolase